MNGGPVGRSAWTAGQVARHLRIAESTLRSWHRRYGVGPRASRPGSYRRYTAEDIARLQRMHDLIRAGMLPSDAAQTIGGPVPVERPLEELVAAARELDNARCLAVLEQAFAGWGVVPAWERLCQPALKVIDADQRTEPDCVDREHVLSWAVTAALHRVDRPPAEPGRPLVLLACVEAEQHTLPLEALAAALAQHRVAVRMLGAAVPTTTLVHAVAAARPTAVVLWAQSPATARLDAIRALGAFPVTRVTAGPGWPRGRLSGTERVATLPAAVALLLDPAG
ncbi:MerR family transcriptional regulator [Actinophytocola sp.]|uniref:MerR family transcriptional regulator n=1 Tax=Actinophytocola sp. TaxID=1872138 RepID=UPI0025B9C68B|nr:MerR family transcriptional regulator [Actinophytocola sp.]